MKAPTLINATSGYSDEFYTPRWLFNRLHDVFNFTLDPASCEAADKGIRYINQEQDGRRVNWANERIFCNPPFSLMKDFLTKTQTINLPSVILVPARVETVYWHKLVWPQVDEILVLKGRLQFERPGGELTKGVPFATVLLGYGGATFEQFEDLGIRIQPIKSVI